MAAVFSLRIENTGDPMMSHIYLKSEKYSSIKLSHKITPPTANKNPSQLLCSLSSQLWSPVSIVKYEITAVADFTKKYMLVPKIIA